MKSLVSYINESEIPTFTLTAVGDALCHDSIYNYFKTDTGYDFSKLFTQYKLDKTGLNYVNMESIIGGNELGLHGSLKKLENDTYQPHFNCPKELGDAIVRKGFNLISLSNNHTLDMDELGVVNSLKYWESQPVITAGSYKSEEDRFEKKIYEKNGIKYAFFAYTMKRNSKNNFSKHPYYRNDWDEELVRKDIEAVRSEVDLVIVSMHWGYEHTFTQNPDQIKAAEFLSSLGVDIVLGMHSHCVQPVQYIGKTLVVYSMGNFIAQQLYNRTDSRVGLEIKIKVIKDKKITLEPSFKLLYMYYTKDYKKFRIIPWEKLTDNQLPNKDYIGETYSKIVNKYNVFA